MMSSKEPHRGLGRSSFGCFVVLPILFSAFLLAVWLIFIQGGSLISPEQAVEKAHRKWDSNDTKLQIEAVKDYQSLLKKTDRFDPSRRWVRDDRDTLYRRVVVHEFKFQKNPEKAREYILDAWDEGIRDLRIDDEEVRLFWDTVVAPLHEKDKIKEKNAQFREGGSCSPVFSAWTNFAPICCFGVSRGCWND